MCAPHLRPKTARFWASRTAPENGKWDEPRRCLDGDPARDGAPAQEIVGIGLLRSTVS